MQATWHKLCSLYRTPQARSTESRDLVSGLKHCAALSPDTASAKAGSQSCFHTRDLACTPLAPCWQRCPSFQQRQLTWTPCELPLSIVPSWSTAISAGSRRGTDTWAHVGSVYKGRLCLHRVNAGHELASALTQQDIPRGKLRERRRNLPNLRKTCLGFKCKTKDFHHLGFFWVGF